MKGGKQEEKE